MVVGILLIADGVYLFLEFRREILFSFERPKFPNERLNARGDSFIANPNDLLRKRGLKPPLSLKIRSAATFVRDPIVGNQDDADSA